MNQQNFSQQDEPAQSPKNYTFLIVILLIVVASIGIYLWQRSTQDNSQTLITTSPSPEISASISGQVYADKNFSYVCPEDWTLGKNKNYNGEVDLSECSMIYSGQMSFDDGVDITFGYVPQNIADSIDTTGQKYSDTILNQVKNQDNVEAYTNGNFVGYISNKNEQHTLALVARYEVEGGYYEVVASAMGDTKTDTQYKKMVDDIISTFQAK